MSSELTTSFIPKPNQGGSRHISREQSANKLLSVSIFILGLTIVFFGLSFGYRYYLLDSINRECHPDETDTKSCGLLSTLEKERLNMDVDRIISLQKVDDKLKKSGDILNNHISLLPLFNFIENTIVHDLQLLTLDFKSPDIVAVTAQANSHQDISVYNENLLTRTEIKEISVSNINQAENGRINFSMALVIDPNLLLYLEKK